GVAFFLSATVFRRPGRRPRFVRRAPRRIDEQHVNLLATRFGQRVESDPGGIGAGGACDDRRTAAATPDVELVDGGGAEGIACGKHDRATLDAQLGRDLADGRGLARAVDADDQGDERLCFLDSERLGDWRKNLFHFSGDDGLYLIGGDRLVVPAFAYRRGDSRRRLDAEIGANERILDFIEHRL